MNYGRPLVLKKSAIGYGCLVALCSVSVAGIAELEIQKGILSKGGKSIETWFSERISNIPQAPQQKEVHTVTFSNIAYPFTWVGEQVSGPVSSAWPYVQEGFKHLTSSFKDIGDAIKNFLKSLLEPEIFNNIFKDLHLKIGRILAFAFVASAGRDSFVRLFGEKNKEATQTAAKFLLGMGQKGSKYFRSESAVFSFLLLQGMLNPTRVTEKFERLSKTIHNLVKKAEGHEDKSSKKGQETQADENHTYVLKVPTVKQYLDVEEGLPEIFFNLMGTGEVASKIKTGYDLTGESKSGISGFFKSS